MHFASGQTPFYLAHHSQLRTARSCNIALRFGNVLTAAALAQNILFRGSRVPKFCCWSNLGMSLQRGPVKWWTTTHFLMAGQVCERIAQSSLGGALPSWIKPFADINRRAVQLHGWRLGGCDDQWRRSHYFKGIHIRHHTFKSRFWAVKKYVFWSHQCSMKI